MTDRRNKSPELQALLTFESPPQHSKFAQQTTTFSTPIGKSGKAIQRLQLYESIPLKETSPLVGLKWLHNKSGVGAVTHSQEKVKLKEDLLLQITAKKEKEAKDKLMEMLFRGGSSLKLKHSENHGPPNTFLLPEKKAVSPIMASYLQDNLLLMKQKKQEADKRKQKKIEEDQKILQRAQEEEKFAALVQRVKSIALKDHFNVIKQEIADKAQKKLLEKPDKESPGLILPAIATASPEKSYSSSPGMNKRNNSEAVAEYQKALLKKSQTKARLKSDKEKEKQDCSDQLKAYNTEMHEQQKKRIMKLRELSNTIQAQITESKHKKEKELFC